MYIKSDHLDRKIMHLPDTACWSISYKEWDKDGDSDGSIYLVVDEKEYVLRDVARWDFSVTLKFNHISDMYEKMVELIGQQIAEDPNLKIIDIDAIEVAAIVEEKWLNKGYIEVGDLFSSYQRSILAKYGK